MRHLKFIPHNYTQIFRIPQILTVNYSYEKAEFLQFLNIPE